MQTKAVVIPEPNCVELQTVNIAAPGPDDVVVKTVYTSISAGTERMLLAGQMPHPMLQLPVVPGYETVGRVAQVGANVTADLKDEWVYVGGAMGYEGVNAAWGGQADTIVTPAQRVIRLKDVPPRQGVLLALTATALHGIDVLDVAAGSRVLVIGQGPVGQLAARIARQRGAWVAVSDLNMQRLERSESDALINVDTMQLSDVLTEPVDAIIEASGSMQALRDALPHLANGGTILLLGYYQKLELPYMPLFLKEAKLLTAKEWGPNDLMRSRDMIADGSLNVGPLLTHAHSVDDIAGAYEIGMNDPTCLKLVVEWQAS